MTSTELALQAFENERPDAAFAALPTDESLSDGIGSGVGVVHYKGKEWTLKKNGETYTFKREDGSPAPYLDVIVLRSPTFLSKTYYREAYKEGLSSGKRPDCTSVRGDRPEADAPSKQAEACGLCPHNAFGTAPGGGKGKACQDYKRLAVLIAPQQTEAAMGHALLEPVSLRIPPASLSELAMLGEAMERKGFHYSSYILRIGFQAGMAMPKFTYQPLAKLGAHEAPNVLALREDPLAYRITGEKDFVRTPSLHNAVAQSVTKFIEQQPSGQKDTSDKGAATVRTTVLPPEKKEATPPVESEVARLRRLLAEAEAGVKQVVEVAPSGPAQSAKPASTTVVVEKAVEESDEELDNLVANLLPR